MAMVKLGLESIDELDGGRIAAAFNEELAAVIRDVCDRPTLEKSRMVALVLRVKPVSASAMGGSAIGAEVTAEVSSKVPKRESVNYSMELCDGQTLRFRPLSPGDPNQHTIDEEIDNAGRSV